MKAILIDPMFNTIKEVQYDGDYKSIYRLIGYSFTKYQPRAFDVVSIPIGFDGIYVDEEGLYSEKKHLWSFKGILFNNHLFNLINKGLVLGSNIVGDTIESDLSLEEIKERVVWHW